MSDKPKALLFDVFGTLVDWRTSIAREVRAGPQAARRRGRLARLCGCLAWRVPGRDGSRCATGTFRSASSTCCTGAISISSCRVSTFRALPRTRCNISIWPGIGSTSGLTSRPACHGCDGAILLAPCSNGNISLMVDIARRNGIHWDAILGSEIAGDYKPKPRVYLASCAAFDLAARRMHDGRRPQQGSPACGGLRIAHRAYCAAERARTREGRARAEGAGRLCGHES